MRFAAAISRYENTADAARDLCESVRLQLRGDIDLLTVFLSVQHREQAERLGHILRRELTPRVLIGCTGESIIGGEREVEGEPAISVLAGQLPNVDLTPYHIDIEEWEDLLEGGGSRKRLARRVGAAGKDRETTRAYIAFADPFTTPIAEWLAATDALTPDAPTVGGMASGVTGPGESALLLNNKVYDQGLVGVRIGGPVRLETVLSQGCRPIGATRLVTRVENNMIATLSGENALESTQAMLATLPSADSDLLENGLYLGVAINEYLPEFSRGDFLIRSVLGADVDTGALAIGEEIRAGQTVQFHVRDAATADEDFRSLLALAATDETAPAGALLFSCNGRGVNLFDMPNHDARCLLAALPETPVAGFFAAGELGPVGGRSFIHGFTASVLLFRPD